MTGENPMAWLDVVQDEVAVRARLERALQAQLGMLSPLWVAFGAATGAGVAWWWLTHWATPINLEAVMAQPPEMSAVVEAPPAAIDPGQIEALNSSESDADEPRPGHEEMETAADDLTRLAGVGPKIAMALEARGVTRFAQLAAWSEADLSTFASESNLKGRALRNDLIEQARKLAIGEG